MTEEPVFAGPCASSPTRCATWPTATARCAASTTGPHLQRWPGSRRRRSVVGGRGCDRTLRVLAGFRRSFCGVCGSSLPDRSLSGGWFVPAGLFASDPGVRPAVHIFRAHRAPWHTIAESSRVRRVASRRDRPVIERPPPVAPVESGALRGSCLCGGIAYEVTEPFMRVHNCHCSRCRRARAAAHTTNGFTTVDGLGFVPGEDLVVTWRLPGARFFAHAFCRACGSGLPGATLAAGRDHPDGLARRRPRPGCRQPHLRRLAGAVVRVRGRSSDIRRGGDLTRSDRSAPVRRSCTPRRTRSGRGGGP